MRRPPIALISTSTPCAFLIAILVVIAFANSVYGRVVVLKNGTEISGDTATVPSIGQNLLAAGGGAKGKSVVVVDDGLRRTFAPMSQVENTREEINELESIKLRQNPLHEGNKIGNVGAILRITPFDDYGRRTFSTLSPGRQLDIVQGITEVTPIWTRVEGMRGNRAYVWDMRIATNSIPREKLRTILNKHLDFDDADVRLSLVRLYLQSEQFGPAEAELNQAIKDFPELEELRQQLRELRQLKAKQQLEEIALRQSVGQHVLAEYLLNHFPVEGVAGETLQTVTEMREAYNVNRQQAQDILTRLEDQIKNIGNLPERKLYETLHRELFNELNHNSLSRMADYIGPAGEKLPEDQQRALALTGWILGRGTENLAVAVSAWEVRKIVEEYLVTADATRRKTLLEQLASQEAGSAAYVAKILAALKPPHRTEGFVDRWLEPSAAGEDADKIPAEVASGDDTPPAADGKAQPKGYFQLTTAGLTENKPITYHIQLPPEYDANRRYPTIVTLHGAGSQAEPQLAWWCGEYNADMKMRMGQASRQGYIVIAPEWAQAKQQKYEYSALENATVLFSLRDAYQRFSIDTDRVFLSGHGMGGDAVWDIALAHPDLWAGVIPISAVAGYEGKASPNYVSRYWENAKQVSFYFVGGSFDKAKMDVNAREFNRYLQHTGYDTMIVEYIGRGDEHFHEEIIHLFDWMKVHERDHARREIAATIMRPWDNFFWWLEVDEIPDGSIVLPAAWPPVGVRPMEVKGSVRDKKNVVIKTGTRLARVFLTPDMVDLSEAVTIYVNGKVRKLDVQPSAATLLEDARRRGDRKHPFWVELEMATGR